MPNYMPVKHLPVKHLPVRHMLRHVLEHVPVLCSLLNSLQ